jgi:metallophosphoesterase superfamily enzyme
MKDDCGNCKFYRDKKVNCIDGSSYLSGYGKCHRHPEATSTNDGKWCGEHQHPLTSPQNLLFVEAKNCV